MSDIKICPFCGNEKIDIVTEHDRTCGRCWFVQCGKCYARSSSIVETFKDNTEPEDVYGNIIRAVEKAKKAWNRRAGDADGQ